MQPKSSNAAVQRAYKLREETLNDIYSDPFIGYKTLEEATDDCRASSQAEVMARLLNGENLFISGPAGSGKTHIIKRFISHIDAAYNGNFNVAVTASTGLAASLIEGRTIHSWSGLGIFDGVFDVSMLRSDSKQKINLYPVGRKVLQYVDVLIIDEISMLHAYYLDNLDTLLKHVRRNNAPFGGVQVVFLGDFMQLPPVPPRERKEGVNYGYAITSQAWKDAEIQYCYMDKIHRTSDPKLKHLLKTIESTKIDDKTHQVIQKCLSNKRDKTKSYTTLFTTNKNVDSYNAEKLAENKNPLVSYMMRRNGGLKKNIDKLLKSRNIPEQVDVKVGATMIVTSNIYSNDKELIAANGSVGEVVAAKPYGVHLRLNNGSTVYIEYASHDESKKVSHTMPNGKIVEIEEIVASISQVPLKLGFAITVHKSQGQTFDGVEVDLSNCFTPGLGYVALSRVRSSDNLIITNFTDASLDVSPSSKKISTYVKRRALRSRQFFIDNVEAYRVLLDTPLALDVRWDDTESGAAREARSTRK